MTRLRANYHSHTKKSRHATIQMGQTIKFAQERGLHTLGFSEHSNLPEGNGSYRLQTMHELKEYIETIRRLKVEYEGDLEVLCGLEVEITDPYSHKNNSNWINFLLEQPGVDYVILGHHNYRSGVHVGFGKPDNHVMVEQYLEDFSLALQSTPILYVAHPDQYCRGMGEWNSESEYMAREMCRMALQANVPLELVVNGMTDEKGYGYPNRQFWQIAAEYGLDVIIGIDSHTDEDWDEDKINATYDFAEELGLKLIQWIRIKDMTDKNA